MKKIETSVVVKLNYTKPHKDGFRIYCEESFFFPFSDEEEETAVFKYIQKMMKTQREFYLYVQRIETDKSLAVWKSDYINCLMFSRDMLDSTSVVKISEWGVDYYRAECYGVNVHYQDIKCAIQELKDAIGIQCHWNDYAETVLQEPVKASEPEAVVHVMNNDTDIVVPEECQKMVDCISYWDGVKYPYYVSLADGYMGVLHGSQFNVESFATRSDALAFICSARAVEPVLA